MRKHEPFEDDGHTVADMSGIENGWRPRRKPAPQEGSTGPEVEMTRKERFWAIMGALKATMFIALFYLLGLGAIIALMVWLW